MHVELLILVYFDMIKIMTIIAFFCQEATATRISFVPNLRIRYTLETPIEEMIDVSPEEEQHVVRAMPSYVSSVTVENQELFFIQLVCSDLCTVYYF